MTDRLDNLKNAKCLVEAWEQKYGVGGHHSKWVNLRPSDIEWAVAEIERLREALKPFSKAVMVAEMRFGSVSVMTPEIEAQMRSYPLSSAFLEARAALEGK